MAFPLRVRRNLLLAACASFIVGASSVHCGSSGSGSSNSGFGAGGSGAGNPSGSGTSTASSMSGSGGQGGDLTLDVQTKDYSAEEFFQNDPPPMTCDGGGMPPMVTGTPECPSDKNLPGCPCQTAGQAAGCWTGLRKNRSHGVCHDGMTTCVPSGETSQLSWGPCDGEQLPTGTTGKAACGCFSGGHWQIDNLEPCFLTVTGPSGTTTTAFAATQGNPATCPFDNTTGVPTVPASWSTDKLTVDCTGTFKLCYTIKAGDGNNPKPTDCVLAKSCTTGYYGTANVAQTFPPLPGWSSTPAMAACVDQFMNTGGYGEMSVDGQSDECELVNKVFQRVTYCPLSCNDPNPPAMCAQCTNGGGGNF
jgi:hypothetical protein